MRRVLSILIFTLLLCATSCVNLLSEKPKTSLSFNLGEETSRFIIDTVKDCRGITEDSIIKIDCALVQGNKTIDKVQLSSTTKDGFDNNVTFNQVPFGEGYKVVVKIKYNDILIFRALSNDINLSEEEINPIVDLDLVTELSKITYKSDVELDTSNFPATYSITSNIYLPSPKVYGYDFDGWYLKDGVTKVEMLGMYNFIGDVEVVAKWKAQDTLATVYVYPEGDIDYGNTVELRTNFSDAKIYYSTDGTIPSLDDSHLYKEPITITSDTSIMAIATKEGMRNSVVSDNKVPLKYYTISFDNLNLGTKPSDIKKYKGQKIVSSDIPFISEVEYEFNGWIHNNLPLTDGYIVTGDTTFVASWREFDTVASVTFSKQGEVDYKDIVELKTDTQNAKIYYSTNGSAPTVDEQHLYKDPITITDAVTIKAIAVLQGMKNSKVTEVSYTIKKYTIDFNNGGKGEVTPNSIGNLKKYDTIPEDRLSPLSVAGYEFNGWKDTKGKVVDSSYKVTESTTVTAQWTPNTYKVVYNGNGSTKGTTAEQTFTVDQQSTLNSNGFSRTGYTFNGWNTSQKGDGTSFTNEQSKVFNLSTTANDSVTLFAQWTPITYKVRFDLVGGSGSVSEMTCTYGKPFTLPTYDNNKSGFTALNKWNTSQDGNGQSFDTGSKCNVNLATTQDQTVTLYAVWRDDAPPAVSNLVATRFDGGMNLSWNKPNVSDIQKYKVSYGEITKETTTNSISISGLSNSVGYTFSVTAIDKGNNQGSATSITKNAMENIGQYDTPKWDSNKTSLTYGVWPQSLKANGVGIDGNSTIKINNLTCYFGTDGYYYVKEQGKNPSGDAGYQFNDKKTTIQNGADYYFKVEPITWKTVYTKTAGKLLVAATKVLSGSPYHNSGSAVTYANCTLRNYLNDTFVKGAFSANSISQNIPDTSIIGGALKCFALCKSDYEKYYTTNSDRVFTVTDYALGTKGLPQHTGTIKTTDIWSRSEKVNKEHQTADTASWYVTFDGNLSTTTNTTALGVLPSIWVNVP